VSAPLLTTKLYIPAKRPNLVSRSRLLGKLDEGQRCKLTLVSAPAGFGKTTLISDWISQRRIHSCWITLDESDNDLGHFLAYLIASLRSIGIEVDEQILTLIQTPGGNQVEDILIPLINQIAVAREIFTLVLDDYHLILDLDIHTAIEFILEHAPPGMHLVLITRSDPPLPLARLRARGEMVEIREYDLRFSVQEGGEFLNQTQGLDLSSNDIEVLMERTDGWAAALQMVAITLRDRRDISAYIQTVSGNQDFIADYLHSEVMDQQPENLKAFLLKTSILDRLSGSLCDAITGGENSGEILRRLRDENLFLTSLDDESTWFRYHRLFADLLGQQLLDTYPDEVPFLYLKASRWFEGNGYYPQAIEYALRGCHNQRAAGLIAQHAEKTLKRSEIATFIRWVKRLPDEAILENENLCIYYAWALLASGGESHLAEKCLNQVAPKDDQTSGRVKAVRSMWLLFNRQTTEAIKLARQSIEKLPEEDLFFRQIAAWNLSALLFIRGESEEGASMLEEVARVSLASNNSLATIIALCRLGAYQMQQGNLKRAQEYFERALHTRPNGQAHPLPAACEALLGLGKVSWERYELEAAGAYLHEGIELSKSWREISDIDSYTTLALVNLSAGDEAGALEMIGRAKKLADKTVTTDTDNRYAGLQEALLFLRQGNLGAVENWALERDLAKFLLEVELVETGNLGADVILRYELIVYARYLIAKKGFDEALNLLEKLLPLLKRLGHQLKIYEIQVLSSIGLYGKGEIDEAIACLNPVLFAAESEGFRRLFFDEGELIYDLLNECIARGLITPFARELVISLKSKRESKQPARISELPEPLSEREIEVLRLLNSELSPQEMAEYLHIALSTLRTHIRNIYGKLGVHSRFEAVSKGKDLDLI
jgi:LuxR family maltose regulon positive regulatory protein